MRVVFVRHGESEGNASGIAQGRLDFGLTPLGLRQAEVTAKALAASGFRPGRVISSPLRRARETADLIADALGLPLERDEALAEYDIGEASGLSGAEIRARFPGVASAWARGERPEIPGEEGREVFHARVTGFLERMREANGDVIAVAHGGVLNAICHIVLGIDHRRPGVFRVENCSISEVITDRAGRFVLARHNDTCHLRAMEANEGAAHHG